MNDDGILIKLFAYMFFIGIITYLIVLASYVIIAVAATGGTLWGAVTAIKNYYFSFRENIIESNR